jgi:hypothetical protein
MGRGTAVALTRPSAIGRELILYVPLDAWNLAD